jgi:ABC-type branched-subunit amino acid transport system ATPase component/branched-subunit amino acid ABC-type transport system permease component
MNSILPFVIIGLTTGSVYGLAAVGLVLTYKTSGIFNFGYGSIAALAAFVFYWLRDEHSLPWGLALFLCVGVLAPALGIGFELIGRALTEAATTIKVLGTIGIVLIVLAIGELWYPGGALPVPPFLPTKTFSVGGTYIGEDQIIIFAIAVVATAVLYVFLRSTRLGMAMRAVVDDANLLDRAGTSPRRVRRWSWMVGTAFAALSGILLVPSIGLDGTVLTLLVVQSFGAASIGLFSNLPMTFLGGIVVGVAESLATKYTASHPALAGLVPSIPFIVLFVVLVLVPRSRLAVRTGKIGVKVHSSYEAPPPVRIFAGGVFITLLALVPFFAGPRLVDYSDLLVVLILMLSLGLVVRTSGQVSLCQPIFAGIGAVAMAHFNHGLGIPWLISLVLAALVTVPAGAIVAVPAIRRAGVYLAIATFGFAILVEQLFYPMNFLFGVSPGGVPANRPSGGIGPWHFSTDNGYYYVLLAITVLVVLAFIVIEKGRLGRLLRAMGNSPVALETHGTTVTVTRVVVFCISAAIAALSGGLASSLFGFAISSQYTSFSGLTLFAAVTIIILGSPWYAVVAAAATVLIPAYVGGSNTATYLQLIFGLGAVTYVYAARNPITVPRKVQARLDRFGRPHGDARTADQQETQRLRPSRRSSEDIPAPQRRPLSSGLKVNGLIVQYGGTLAVSDVSFNAPLGAITGLIGPNGAGKTSTFNAVSGLVRCREGSITLGGVELRGMTPSRRAQSGLGRTFQRSELFDSLTVRRNIEMGCEASLAGRRMYSQLIATPGDRGRVAAATRDAVELAGVADLLDIQAGLLSTGQRRLVELAAVLAGPFDMLLLDEPSSGLDARESAAFGTVLRHVVAERGTGILIVEHDMRLVQEICDYVYVLDFGSLLFQGTTEEMRNSEVVREAYLGQVIEATVPAGPDEQ